MKLAAFIYILRLVSAAQSSSSLHPRAADAPLHVIFGAPGQVISANLPTNEGFDVKKNVSLPDARPSWLLYHRERGVIYAADETSTSLLEFTYNSSAPEKLAPVDDKTNTKLGSPGVVHLAFNKDQTRMLGCGNGAIDVWNTGSTTQAPLKTLPQKSSTSWGEAALLNPQQAILDLTGRFFLVNDPEADAIFFINAEDSDEFALNSTLATTGCGPRHGVLHQTPEKSDVYYTVVCQKSKELRTYKLTYDKNTIKAAPLHTTLVFDNGNSTLPNGAMPSEVILAGEGKHLYVSIQNAGGLEDNILLFNVDEDNSLVYQETFGAGGRMPQMMSLSNDGKVLFVANLKGPLGLVAWERQPKEGRLVRRRTESRISHFTSEEGSTGGPRFIMEVPEKK